MRTCRGWEDYDPTDGLADGPVLKICQKLPWMTKIYRNQEKHRQGKEKNGCPQNESNHNWESRRWETRTPDPLIKSQLLYQLS